MNYTYSNHKYEANERQQKAAKRQIIEDLKNSKKEYRPRNRR